MEYGDGRFACTWNCISENLFASYLLSWFLGNQFRDERLKRRSYRPTTKCLVFVENAGISNNWRSMWNKRINLFT